MEATTASAGSEDASPAAWAPLRAGSFRALWLAALVGLTGVWFQTVGAQWLLVSSPHASILVSLVQVATTLPVRVVRSGRWCPRRHPRSQADPDHRAGNRGRARRGAGRAHVRRPDAARAPAAARLHARHRRSARNTRIPVARARARPARRDTRRRGAQLDQHQRRPCARPGHRRCARRYRRRRNDLHGRRGNGPLATRSSSRSGIRRAPSTAATRALRPCAQGRLALRPQRPGRETDPAARRPVPRPGKLALRAAAADRLAPARARLGRVRAPALRRSDSVRSQVRSCSPAFAPASRSTLWSRSRAASTRWCWPRSRCSTTSSRYCCCSSRRASPGWSCSRRSTLRCSSSCPPGSAAAASPSTRSSCSAARRSARSSSARSPTSSDSSRRC